jgi:small redox-active disulfide protein 2
MLTIKILGLGSRCETCKTVEKLARETVAMMGMEAEFIKVDEWVEIKKYPIVATPGLVINEKLVCSGRIPTQAEVTTWLTDALS